MKGLNAGLKLDAGLMTSLPASDPGSAAVWGSKRINPRPQSCLCLTWSGYLFKRRRRVFALKILFINFIYKNLSKVANSIQPIENILLKHNTGVILCFNKNISVDQNLLHKDLFSDKKLFYFAEQAKISYELAISSL